MLHQGRPLYAITWYCPGHHQFVTTILPWRPMGISSSSMPIIQVEGIKSYMMISSPDNQARSWRAWIAKRRYNYRVGIQCPFLEPAHHRYQCRQRANQSPEGQQLLLIWIWLPYPIYMIATIQGDTLTKMQVSYKLYSSGTRCFQILTMDNPASRMISSARLCAWATSQGLCASEPTLIAVLCNAQAFASLRTRLG